MSSITEKNLKILHINSNYIYTLLHQNMIESLNKKSIYNDVYVPTYYGHKTSVKCNDNVIVSECYKKYQRYFFFYKQKKILDDVYKKYDISTYNCIHAYTLFTDGNIAFELFKKKHIPYVVAVRNTDVNLFFKYRKFLKKRGIEILKNAKAIFFLSETYENYLYEKYVPKKIVKDLKIKTYIIPNGIDDFWHKNLFKPKKINLNDINIIFAGRIDTNKNVVSSIKAINLLLMKGYNIKFSIVGNIIDKNSKKNINKYSNIKYYQRMNKENLIKLYRKSDIFLMPSHTETFGLVYAEAMSQGLPIVYTKNQGFDGQFEEGKVGFHVDDNNIDDIASAIEKIFLNYEKLSDNCIKCCKKFKWDNVIDTYFHIYKKICYKQGAFNERNRDKKGY